MAVKAKPKKPTSDSPPPSNQSPSPESELESSSVQPEGEEDEPVGLDMQVRRTLVRRIKAHRQELKDIPKDHPRRFTRIIELKRLIALDDMRIKYAGVHPKEVPVEDLEFMRSVDLPGASALENKYRNRITSRPSAIRSFCVTCMGGNLALVRTCESANCPLWAFRMGTDPLRGKVTFVEEIEGEESDEADDFEEDDDGDQEEADEDDE